MTAKKLTASERHERDVRAARISAAQAIVAINKRLRQPTDPEIVELSKQSA